MSEATDIITRLLEHNETSDSLLVRNSLVRLKEIFESQEEALSQYSDKNNWAKGSLKKFGGSVFNHDLWVGGGHGWAVARKVVEKS